MLSQIMILKRNQSNYKRSRGRTDLVAELMTANKRKKDNQEDPDEHGECINARPWTLDLIGIGKRIRFQVCMLQLSVTI